MIEEKKINDIRKLTSSLLKDSISQVDAEKSINEIHAHFQQITQITGYDFQIEHMAAISTAKGKALGLNFAAQCLLDYKRTVKFLKAIVSAILEKQKKQPGKLIKIFYAGCGPYAPFITLVAPLFQPDEVQFSLLEINKNSVASAKKLIDSLKLPNYIQDFYTADAVTFKVPNSNSFDILISETLDALLYRECYVPILFNLLPQFNKDIVLIPENVIINLSFLPNAKKQSAHQEYEIGSILNVREALADYSISDLIPSKLPDKKIDLTSLDMNSYQRLLLDTKVHIHGDIWLDRNESSLTIPLESLLAQPFQNSSIIFTYYIEPEIELKCRFE
ncbi:MULTISPECIES: SAM-dependent methyltransferase [Mesonia]|uniref:Uncharacterized protein n=1 Tax=Mesonia oceanica TaxID=2687242 RepID=A0AC61Y933_9FLAO|nr:MULTISPECIES: phytanoyl-CoA dioxygenase [Mesonia]MAN28320.1 phytanoyl-CoA dioxygenase [Mesonia sp.]MAQ39732.1 phytanoyl-CoA dioxygenase [Mesonia sp.]VVU99854.1 hypothetical protein FVB9532_01115 [Mesonia oceanica]|tara:strand:- start:12641 stop:13639 length:999 start_codon:yes stop_codon:yes gene_type:complete